MGTQQCITVDNGTRETIYIIIITLLIVRPSVRPSRFLFRYTLQTSGRWGGLVTCRAECVSCTLYYNYNNICLHVFMDAWMALCSQVPCAYVHVMTLWVRAYRLQDRDKAAEMRKGKRVYNILLYYTTHCNDMWVRRTLRPRTIRKCCDCDYLRGGLKMYFDKQKKKKKRNFTASWIYIGTTPIDVYSSAGRWSYRC